MELGLFSIPGLRAPEFNDSAEWLNITGKIKLTDLKHRIIILDFWSYCCINCIHMLPILEQIEKKYSNKKVVVIGVHSPKFKTERNKENVIEAIKRYQIKHPVILDKNMKIWRSYGAEGWPTFVVIDPNGKIAAKFSGEISYKNFEEGLEKIIKKFNESNFSKTKFLPEFKKIHNKSFLRYPGKIDINKKTEDIVVSDSGNNRVIILDKSGKILYCVESNDKFFKINGKTINSFNMPQGVCWINEDEVMVADTGNNVIKKINLESKVISIEAGTGELGRRLKINEEHIATNAKLSSPWDITFYKKELLITMSGSHQIVKYDMDSTISHFAGTGKEDLEDGTLNNSYFAQPSGVSVFKDMIYTADSESSSIRSISVKNNFVSTVVGAGLFVFGNRIGKLQDTLLQHPMGLCAVNNGIYIADTFNNSIKYINLRNDKSYQIISQNEKSVCNINDPECDTLGLFEPNDVKIYDNYLYICDTNNHLIRKYDIKKRILKTIEIEK